MADKEEKEEVVKEEVEEEIVEEVVEEENTEPEELDVNQEVMTFLVELKDLVINMQQTIDQMVPPAIEQSSEQPPAQEQSDEPTDLQADLVKLDEY